MNPLSVLLQQLSDLAQYESDAVPLVSNVFTSFCPPTLHIDVISARFGVSDDVARLELLAGWLHEYFGLPKEELLTLTSRLPVAINLLTPQEHGTATTWRSAPSDSSWVTWFSSDSPSIQPTKNQLPCFHFYGYKGGQGRSTVLALLAKALADDGYRVLAVDADMEAPSLDSLLDASGSTFAQSFMGACGWSSDIKPIQGAYSGRDGGQVDLLPCRPRNAEADLDFALLIATAPLDLRIYERAAAKIESVITRDSYDLAIIDHRTGISSSVLPIMRMLPGSAVVFTRCDSNLSQHPSELFRVVNSIFSSMGDSPGAYVAFSLDPNGPSELGATQLRLQEQLLLRLAQVNDLRSRESNQEATSAEEMEPYWVTWPFDRHLLDGILPALDHLNKRNVDALRTLREVLGLPLGKKRREVYSSQPLQAKPDALSVSGAQDDGAFILTPEIKRLFVQGSNLTYILGRKGTGKTRLLRELAKQKLGVPLLVASDEHSVGGVASQSPEVSAWLDWCKYDPKVFWLALVRCGIEARQQGQPLAKLLAVKINGGINAKTLANPLALKSGLSTETEAQTLLIDGLETLVDSERMRDFVAALLNLMATVQNDPQISAKLTLRLFIREDLTIDTVQNIEQQMEGRLLRLRWSVESILNFAVSRIPSLPWISKTYSSVCDEVKAKAGQIGESGLTAEEATSLLLNVFPHRLRRNNILTSTFLRLYFSDAGGEDTDKATFYPRLYLYFLQKLDEIASTSQSPMDEDGRLASSLLISAYDQASSGFIEETKQELIHLLKLTPKSGGSSSPADGRVSRLIAAFDGLRTPFELESLIDEIQGKTGFTSKSIRESLLQMKAIRMFEDRPGYAGWWRVGQLYKMGLRMKYVRG